MQGQAPNTPALYCPHCLANFANLTHVGVAIVVRDEHPEFTQDDVVQEMQCQDCEKTFYVVPNSAEHQHEWVDREGEDFCGHCFVARKQTKPSNLSGLLTKLRTANGTITISSGVLTFADGTSHNLGFIQ